MHLNLANTKKLIQNRRRSLKASFKNENNASK